MGKGSPAMGSPPVAGGKSSGAALSPGTSSRRREQRTGERMRLGFQTRSVLTVLSSDSGAGPSDFIRRPAAVGAREPGRRAVLGWAGKESGGWCPPHRAARVRSRPWAASGHGPFCFYRTQFYWFLFSFLSNFDIVFSIQNIPTKILFREFKSYRIFSAKFKVYEFRSCFRCK
jgi:hypothetical protein